MRFLNVAKILVLASLGLLLLPAFMPSGVPIKTPPVMASYNPAPADNFHAPLSSVALLALPGAKPNVQSLAVSTSRSNSTSSLRTIQQNALRFIIDTSYFPQSETSIAADPSNPSHVVGGFNDDRYFFCRFLPADCGNQFPVSLSGFSTSTDGGKTVAKTSNIPDLNVNGTYLTSWGDPSVAPAVDGSFFYASLAINQFSPIFGNGMMIAKSNPNLFNSSISCATSSFTPTSNACWTAVFVSGAFIPAFSLEDKDRIAVDRDPSSPYFGSVYLSWDHFYPTGYSAGYLARCDGNLTSCTLLSGGSQPVLTGSDPFVAWTTPTVDKNGSVHVTWCNFGTLTTFGPVTCRTTSSPPGGTSFGPTSKILSYMGAGTDRPTDTIVIGWATEQFRVASGIISIAADLSQKTNNLYFTTQVCTSGHYDAFSSNEVFGVAADNPGNCGQSAVILSQSTDGGSSWSHPTTLSNPAVNDQPFVTVDPQTGTIYAVYYTTQYDTFNHRTDVVASISNNQGRTFHQQRITSVSDEPNADPNMYNYIVPGGFGGSLSVPQYGDYFEATALGGTLWVLFSGNYAVEAGTFQADPFLAVSGQNG